MKGKVSEGFLPFLLELMLSISLKMFKDVLRFSRFGELLQFSSSHPLKIQIKKA